MGIPISCDRSQAEKFIAALTGDARTAITWQSFPDHADLRKKLVSGGYPTAYTEPVSLDDWDGIMVAHDAGISHFVVINETVPGGRKAKDVRGLRALFIDDDKGVIKPDDPRFASCPPSIVVQSKNGLHIYWLLEAGEPLDSFGPAQVQLAKHFGTDPKIKNLDRVMRCPGFLHRKDPNDPFLVTVVATESNHRYRVAQILAAFPAPAEPESVTPTNNSDFDENRGDGFHTGPVESNEGGSSTGFGIPRYGTLTAFERAERYVAVYPPAVQGASGDQHTFILCCKLSRGFDLDEVDCIGLLMPWSDKCVPPWNEGDLLAKLRSARSNGTEPVGGMMDSDQAETASPGPSAESPRDSAAAASSPRGSRRIYPWKTLDQLVQQKFPPMVQMAPYLVRGYTTALDGAPKAGKTTYLMSVIVRGVLSGSIELGVQCEKTPIVVLTEIHGSMLVRDLSRVCPPGTGHMVHTLCSPDCTEADWPELVTELCAAVAETGAGLVIIDTLPHFAGVVDENDAGPMKMAMKELSRLKALNCAILVTRHTRKSGGTVGEAARGSNAGSGECDFMTQIEEVSGPDTQRLFTYKGREEWARKRVLDYDHDARRFALVGSRAEESAKEVEAYVLRRLEGFGDFVPVDVLFCEEYADTRIRDAANNLAKANAVEKRGGFGEKKNQHRYRLAQPLN